MTTTVAKTIGTGGDYTTMQAWEDATPVDLTAVDQIWQGQLKNQLFQGGINDGIPMLLIGGSTSDATRYPELTTAAGASFADNVSATSNPLAFDSSKGAAIECRSVYSSAIQNSGTNQTIKLNKLQVRNTQTGNGAATLLLQSTFNIDVRQCIVEWASASISSCLAFEGGTLTRVANCLFVPRVSSCARFIRVFQHTEIYNSTLVVPSDFTGASNFIFFAYAVDALLKNCAFFGAGGALWTDDGHSGGLVVTSTTCKTDKASPPTGWTQVAFDTTTGSGFQVTTDAAHDFRIKSTSALKDAGTTEATYASLDIVGQTRVSTDVGAWEFVAGGVPVLSAAGVISITTTTATPQVTLTF